MRFFLFFLLSLVGVFAKVPANDICMLSIAKAGSTMSIITARKLTGYGGAFFRSYYKIGLAKELPEDYMTVGHFFNLEALEKGLDDEKKIYIVIVRDLRDVLVSASRFYNDAPFYMYHWQGKIDEDVFREKKQQWLRNKEGGLLGKNVEIQLDDREYVSDTILDIKNAVTWLKRREHLLNNRVLIIRYEDLVGKKGGGSQEKQYETVRRVANFIDVEISDEKLQEIADELWGSTETFAIGKANNYHKYFTEETTKKFWSLFSEEMEYLGYDR